MHIASSLLFLLSMVFFSECYCAHRDLHSFPTRRSSDLDLLEGGFGCLDVKGIVVVLRQHLQPLCSGCRIADGDLFLRSEEHTSELQSRFDLVCRLLLEKKKTQQT